MALKVFEEDKSYIETLLDPNDKTKFHQTDVGRYIESGKINQVITNIPPEDLNCPITKQRSVLSRKNT